MSDYYTPASPATLDMLADEATSWNDAATRAVANMIQALRGKVTDDDLGVAVAIAILDVR